MDAVVEAQRLTLSRFRRLADAGHQPHATWVAQGQVEQSEARIRWSQANRHLFE